MKNRNLYGLTALLLLLALIFGGSLMCPPASERSALPPESEQWREQPAPAALAQGENPERVAANAAADAATHEVLARVTDMAGAPILGAEIFINWADKPGAAAAARGHSGLDGTWLCESLPAARYKLHAVATGYFPSAIHPEFRIPSVTRQEIVLPLERGGLVSGFVYGLDGYEVPYAWFRMRDLDSGATLLVRADERGAFESAPLHRGAWELAWIEHEQAEPDPRIVWTTLVEPGMRVEVIATLDRATRGAARADRTVGIVPLRRGG